MADSSGGRKPPLVPKFNLTPALQGTPSLTSYQPDGSAARPTPNSTYVAHGLEGAVFRDSGNIVKAFYAHGDMGAQRRDSEMAALQSLHHVVPDLVPQPFSSGQATTTHAPLAPSPAIEMSALPGAPLSGDGLSTPRLQEIRPDVRRMGEALARTNTVWDKTTQNLLLEKTPHARPKFIDLKMNSSAPVNPDEFERGVLKLMAARPDSVDRILAPPTPAAAPIATSSQPHGFLPSLGPAPASSAPRMGPAVAPGPVAPTFHALAPGPSGLSPMPAPAVKSRSRSLSPKKAAPVNLPPLADSRSTAAAASLAQTQGAYGPMFGSPVTPVPLPLMPAFHSSLPPRRTPPAASSSAAPSGSKIGRSKSLTDVKKRQGPLPPINGKL